MNLVDLCSQDATWKRPRLGDMLGPYQVTLVMRTPRGDDAMDLVGEGETTAITDQLAIVGEVQADRGL